MKKREKHVPKHSEMSAKPKGKSTEKYSMKQWRTGKPKTGFILRRVINMGEISTFIIGGIVGIIVSAVGLEKVVVILKETISEAIPVLLGLI